MSQDSQPRARLGLLLVFWSIVAGLALSLVESLVLQLRLLPPESTEVIFRIAQAVSLLAMVPQIIGLIVLTRLPQPPRASLLATIALVATVLIVTLDLAWLVIGLVARAHTMRSFNTVMLIAWRVIYPVGAAALLLLLHRVARAQGQAVRGVIVLVTLALMLAWQAISTWLMFRAMGEPRAAQGILATIRWVMSYFTQGLVATVVGVAAWTLPGDWPSTSAMSAPDGTWAPAARGLLLHRRGVLVKIVVTIVGVVLMVLAGLAREASVVRGLMLIVPLATLVGTALALAGLVGWTRAPAGTGARELAIVALALSVLGVLVDLYVLTVICQLVFDRPSFALLDQIQLLEPVGLAIALLSLLLLLASLRRAARLVEASELVTRTITLSVLLGLLIPLATVLKLPPVARALGPALIALALPVLGLAIYALVSYLGLLRELAARLLDRPAA